MIESQFSAPEYGVVIFIVRCDVKLHVLYDVTL